MVLPGSPTPSRSGAERPPASRAAGRLAAARRLFAERHFRWLAAARWTSQASDGLFQAALASFLLFNPERAASAGQLAGLLAVTLLPFSLLGPFVGVFIDRWPRRPILTVVPVVRAGLSLVVAGELAAGVDGPALYGVVLLSLSLNRFYLATQSASLPHVVRRDELLAANSVAPTGGTIAAFCGAAAGAMLYRAAGGPSAESVSALAYAASALLSLRLPRGLLGPDLGRPPPALGQELHRVWQDLVDGARVVARSRPAAAALGAIFLTRCLVGLLFVGGLLAIRSYLGSNEAGLAAVIGAAGAGTVLAALVTPVAGRYLASQAIVTAGLTASGVATFGLLAGFGSRAAYALALEAVSFLLGCTAAATKIAVDTIVQESIPDAYRGRAFSLYDILYNVAFVLAALAAVAVLPPTGRSAAVTVAVGLAWLAGALAYDRRRRAEPAHTPRDGSVHTPGDGPARPAGDDSAPLPGAGSARTPGAGSARTPGTGRPAHPPGPRRGVEVRCYAGGRGDELPRAMVVDGHELAVTVERGWVEERVAGALAGAPARPSEDHDRRPGRAPDRRRRRVFDVRMADGRRCRLAQDERDGTWTLEGYLGIAGGAAG